MSTKNVLAGIPAPAFAEQQNQRFALAVKQNLEHITGQLGDRLVELPVTATTADIITAINLIIRRLNGT